MDAETLQKRVDRERAARHQAEALLESKSAELYKTNQELISANEALAGRTALLNTILDHAIMGFFLVDDSFRITRTNRAAESMFSAVDGELTGSNVLDVFAESSRADAMRMHASAAPTDTPPDDTVAKELEGLSGDGTPFPVELAITALESGDGARTVWLLRDMTRRKLAEAERVELERELSQALKLEALGTLSSGIAHEINTPVQYVGDNVHFMRDAIDSCMSVLDAYDTFLAVLPSDSGGEDARGTLIAAKDAADLDFLKEEMPGAVDQALEGIAQITKIVTAIKEFSHPGVVEKTEIDLNKSIETTITVSRNQWKYVADLEARLDPNLPLVPCLPGDINQVILNLIVNAAHAIEEKGAEGQGKIVVQTLWSGDYAEILVGDTGNGIKPENLKKIFDPFFTTKGVGKGTGQGLSITHGIVVKKHGGEIDCESEVGKGTVFTLRLPLANARTMEAAE